MSGWRNRLARKKSLSRRADPGSDWIQYFVGIIVALLLGGLGVGCLIAEAIPVGTRAGILWIGDARKDFLGYAMIALAIALHVGLVWPKVPALRRFWIPPMVVALGTALVTFGLSLG
jgi:hypothetical protein